MSGLVGGHVDAMPTQEPELARLMSRIQDANSRLAKLHEVGQKTANRVFGSMPEAAQSGAKGPLTDGLLSMLHCVVDDLHSRITDCDDDMKRLQAL